MEDHTYHRLGKAIKENKGEVAVKCDTNKTSLSEIQEKIEDQGYDVV
ncbi:hypothetical protein [Planomicrobium soli]|nr:hypothetical protein [Planomicrobium soli]